MAVVEHQLVDVRPGNFDAPAPIALDSDRRWTVIQEVRLVRPADFKSFIRSPHRIPPDLPAWKAGTAYDEGDFVAYDGETYECIDDHTSRSQSPPDEAHSLWHRVPGDPDLETLSPSGELDEIGSAVKGYLRTEIRNRLAQGTGAELDKLAPPTLLVEASAACWIRQSPAAESDACTLQFLPAAAQLAVLAGPGDFGPSDPDDPSWLLLAMPFLGRLQHQDRDALAPSPGAPPSGALEIDPVLHLQRRRGAAGPLPPLALILASWGEATAAKTEVAAFDAAVGRTLARLESSSLEEALFRLHHLPAEPTTVELGSVLAARPDTPARLSRPAALARAFDVARPAYPPVAAQDGGASPDPIGPTSTWRPGSLLVTQADSNTTGSAVSFGWHVTAAILASSPLFLVTGRRRHAAATQLPVPPSGMPVTLAISPYLGVQRRPAPGGEGAELRLVSVELLGQGAGALRQVATRMIETGDRGAARSAALAWARETHRLLSPNSPVAVVRLREISEVKAGDQAVLTTTYGFALVADLVLPEAPSRGRYRLRARATELRFRDGHFGGEDLPAAPRPFELAPPQVTGVQPIYRGPRLASPPGPWGLGALRVSVRYTDGATGVIGGAIHAGAASAALYWQSLPHAVQFRSGASADAPAAGLPPQFRAPAIRSLLPVLPDAPLPPITIASLTAGDGDEVQPVVPGAVRHLLTGLRPGVMLALRAQLQRQSLAEPTGQVARAAGMVSGSVPVQHRAPRPVPLPPNRAEDPEVALQTWASAFEPTAGVRSMSSPLDEAYFAGPPAKRLRLELQTPRAGALEAGWSGALIFRVDGDTEGQDGPPVDPIAGFAVSAELVHGDRLFSLDGPHPVSETERLYRFSLSDADRAALLAAVAARAVLAALVRVERTDAADGFAQVLSFPLVAVGRDVVGLPLEPAFVHFEDPEITPLGSTHVPTFAPFLRQGPDALARRRSGG